MGLVRASDDSCNNACRRRDERVTLLREAVDRPLVRRPVHAHIGHRRRRLLQLLVEVEVVAEPTARQEIPLETLYARLDLL